MSQLEESESRRECLQLEVGGLTTSNNIMLGQLSSASAEIEELFKYKKFVHQLTPHLQSIKRDVNLNKSEISELTRELPPFVAGLEDWMRRVTALHINESLGFNARSHVLCNQVDKLQSVIEQQDVALVEAEQTIQNLQETAHGNIIARNGERLTWEKAMEDLKVQHKKELSKLHWKAMDDAVILGNQIAELKSTIKKQQEDNDRKCLLIVTDWQRKLDGHDAVISRIKYESALEIQGLSMKVDDMNGTIASKDREIISLFSEVSLMNERQGKSETEFEIAFEALSITHQSALEAMDRIYDERIRQTNDELLQKEREKENSSALAQQQVAELKTRIASDHFRMIREVATIKSQLDNLRVMTFHHAESIQQEWGYLCKHVLLSRLKSLKRKLDLIVERSKVEMDQLRENHAMEEATFRVQQEVSEKEIQVAKAMLFNTIRENKNSLECALRQQAKKHKREIDTLSNESTIQCKAIAAQLEQMSNENDALGQENAKMADAISAKDKELLQATGQASDIVIFWATGTGFVIIFVRAQTSIVLLDRFPKLCRRAKKKSEQLKCITNLNAND